MIENEDSVVTSLKELRKLKNERITRQSQSRSASRAKRVAAPVDDPAADLPTPGPVEARAALGSAHASVARTAPARETASPAFFATNSYATTPMPAPTMVRTRTSYKATAVVAALLLGAGGAGYVKLQSDAQAILAAKDALIKRAEQADEARGKAVEQASKTEQMSKSNLQKCEDKLKAALAVAPPASAPSVASVQSAKKPEKAAARGRFAASKAVSKATGKATGKAVRRTAQAEPVAPRSSAKSGAKSEDTPLIAKKKHLDNDPLDGLGK